MYEIEAIIHVLEKKELATHIEVLEAEENIEEQAKNTK